MKIPCDLDEHTLEGIEGETGRFCADDDAHRNSGRSKNFFFSLPNHNLSFIFHFNFPYVFPFSHHLLPHRNCTLKSFSIKMLFSLIRQSPKSFFLLSSSHLDRKNFHSFFLPGSQEVCKNLLKYVCSPKGLRSFAICRVTVWNTERIFFCECWNMGVNCRETTNNSCYTGTF